MNCSVRSTFGFEESALNAGTVIKIIPITPIAKKMHEGKLSNPASIAEPFKFALSTMSVVNSNNFGSIKKTNSHIITGTLLSENPVSEFVLFVKLIFNCR